MSTIRRLSGEGSTSERPSSPPSPRRSPTPGGTGDAPTVVAPARAATPARDAGFLPIHWDKVNPPLTELEKPESVAAPAIAVTPPQLPQITSDQQTFLLSMYKELGGEKGTIRHFVYYDGGFLGSRWIAFPIQNFMKKATQIKEQGLQMRQEVHPLAFLLWLRDNSDAKGYVLAIASGDYNNNWKSRIGNLAMRPFLKLTGEKTTSPWDSTCESLRDDIKKHKESGTLQLEAFLQQIPEEKREEARRIIENPSSSLEDWKKLVGIVIN